MDFSIAAFLVQDGLISGAVYALLGVAIVLVFSVTRVIFVPQGEFVAYSALTMAALQAGKTPGTLWLLLMASAVACIMELWGSFRAGDKARAIRGLLVYGAAPAALAAVMLWALPPQLPMLVQALIALLLVVPLGPLVYRIVYQPVAHGSVLVLLIISVALHLALTSFGLLVFGAEGSRTPTFSDERWQVGPLSITGQSIWVIGASVVAIALLAWFFTYTFRGKALKATSVNRVGAELMAISPTGAGSLAFTLAAAIGGLSGLLIGPINTMFYDTGFMIGLKGFVAAIVGGLVSYPLAALGALLVGLLESFSSFWASSYKEVAVFTLILPVLLWRSLRTHHVEEDEE
ncbi:branched-chain amino acid ABC transporter permease [Variovorax sp. YR216]|uniref:branched-chain amino acid ABC transporter permease n=1 Tax=Variovorax sp. YR216 TaxID=1882828 RepID=UPI00089C951F|nr:branched-chain amino acid ABC transporter permease [Variovorax sp. YR216]SEA86825.1 amino acid/amide ABC transporter membrane protein 1, HAAT family [Variovorax sp. YR216]